jgi:ubiquinone/menaquinone biosynthesis C-methylase UbiE
MFRRILQNCRKPRGLTGWFILKKMNAGHAAISRWGLSHLSLAKDARVLDVGCGGGANVRRLLGMCPDGFVEGLDYSERSVKASRGKNASEIGKRCDIRLGSVSAMPYDDGAFDAVVAFETVYFWPDAAKDFREVRRVLRPGGTFLICNEASDPADVTWTDRIDGMRVYGEDELIRSLSDGGFEVTGSHSRENGWLCVTAKARD